MLDRYSRTKHPYVILKFKSAALCKAGLKKLSERKRQRTRWSVQSLDAVRLKLSYDEPKTRHHVRLCVVKPYLLERLGKEACAVLGPDDEDPAEGPATGEETGRCAGVAANDAAANDRASTIMQFGPFSS